MELYQITHPEERVKNKVNFLADYFRYFANRVCICDFLEIENFLSLVEKTVFQIETNPQNCVKYIDSHLSHPLLNKSNKYFKEFKNYDLVQGLIDLYKTNESQKQKGNWINKNPEFSLALKRFRTELKKVMFKSSLKNIISFLLCNHDIAEHRDDIIHHSNIIASEFLLYNRSIEDLSNIFNKVLSKQIDEYPFSEKFIKENKDNLHAAKVNFIKNRDFHQQFSAILHFYKGLKKKEYFVYRVFNIDSYETFEFKYNRVKFYHPNHPKILRIKELNKKTQLITDFFKKDNFLLAVIQVDSYSKRIAEKIAINNINRELEFLNSQLNSNAYLERHTYLTTTNFENLGWRWNSKERPTYIKEKLLLQLKSNPYEFLKGVHQKCRNHFLSFEPLFIKASNSGNPADYWHYFETLFHKSNNSTQEIINTISEILSNAAVERENSSIELYLKDLIVQKTYKSKIMDDELKSKISYKSKFDFKKHINQFKHPFLIYLINERILLNNNETRKSLKAYYSRILWECYSQRNSIIHSNLGSEKSLIMLDYKLLSLTSSLRMTLVRTMKKDKAITIEKLLK